jgi:hypothetical protein
MDIAADQQDAALPKIPHLHAGALGMLDIAQSAPEQFHAVMAAGRAHYGAAAMAMGNAFSRHWLARNENPYLAEIDELAAMAGAPGVHLLNMSYEWTCTSSAAPDPSGVGARLLRTLDWPLDGLGRQVIVANVRGAVGDYENITWPGFTGVVTAMAPGRFAAALNQPPMRQWTRSCWLDWAVNRTQVWRSMALPPVHVLRRVFDTCKTYSEARDMLEQSPLAMPAFFTLVGLGADDGCVIERSEERAYVRNSPASVANHWVAASEQGRSRGVDSEARYMQMESALDNLCADNAFDWVKPPILNPTTRIAVVANPATGHLNVQGWETDGPATAVFSLG